MFPYFFFGLSLIKLNNDKTYMTSLYGIISSILSYVVQTFQHLPYADVISTLLIAIVGGIISGFLVIFVQNRLTKHISISKSISSYGGIDHPTRKKEFFIQISICNNGKLKIDYLTITFKLKEPAEFGSITPDGRVPHNVEYSHTSGKIKIENKHTKERIVKIKNIFPDTAMAFMFQLFDIKNPGDLRIEFHSEVKPEVLDFLSNDLGWFTGSFARDSKTAKGKISEMFRWFQPKGYALREGEWDPITWEGEYPYDKDYEKK